MKLPRDLSGKDVAQVLFELTREEVTRQLFGKRG
jgi:hypothetical protein